MTELANFILEMEAPHPNFRVWITTEPHKDFPVSLLQMCIKYTCEAPQGIPFVSLNKDEFLHGNTTKREARSTYDFFLFFQEYALVYWRPIAA